MKYLLILSLLMPLAAHASDYVLTIKDHQFQPAEIAVPAGQKIRLRIENHDVTPEEFESKVLNREKVIVGRGSATLHIGPLEPGRYPFVGEFHEQTAQGIIIVE